MNVRNEYKRVGSADKFYQNFSSDYKNPHKDIIIKLLEDFMFFKRKDIKIMDLSCGDGLVTEYLKNKGFVNIFGVDPYFKDIYEDKTKKKCYKKDFKTLPLSNEIPECDLVICSFAMHLCDKSMLPALLYKLAELSKEMIIITPHKRPEINLIWKLESEALKDKVRLRSYKKEISY